MTGRSAGVFIVFFPTVSLPVRPADITVQTLESNSHASPLLSSYIRGTGVKRLPSFPFREDLPFKGKHLNVFWFLQQSFGEPGLDAGMIEEGGLSQQYSVATWGSRRPLRSPCPDDQAVLSHFNLSGRLHASTSSARRHRQDRDLKP